jgi:hypothetical protein
MTGRAYGHLGVSLSVAAAVLIFSARPAQARCGDFGGLGVMFGAASGLGATLVGGFVFPAVAVAAKPGLRYWPGVGYTMAGGAAGTLLGTIAVSADCPDPESLYVPALMAVSAEAVTAAIWASASKPEPPPIEISVGAPRAGEGAVLSLSGRF